MRLISLKLENFQGIKAAEFEFGGRNATIYGDNATGKTTVFNAMTWLLFGSASTGAKGYTPKTRSAVGDTHNLIHAATAAFSFEDGRVLTLSKSYHEVYKKKKGSPTQEFSGHTTDYFVDGVPVKEKEYQAAITDICDTEQLKILSMPHYFSENMTWEARRKLLLEVCGEVNDQDIFATMPELKERLGIPGTSGQLYSVEEYKKIAGARKTAINRELTEIPSRIDEASRSLADIPEISEEQLNADLENALAELERLQKVYDDNLQGDDGAAELTKRIGEELTKLERLKGEHMREEAESNAKVRIKITALEGTITETKAHITAMKNKKNAQIEEYSHLTDKRNELVKEYNEIAAMVFDTRSTVCPTCGREYPPEKVEELVARFNKNKSDRLTALNERGKRTASKEMIVELESAARMTDEEIESANDKLAELSRQLDEARKQVVTLPPVEDTDEYKTCAERIDALEAERERRRENTSDRYKTIVSEMSTVRAQISELQGIQVRQGSAQSIKARIAELEDREKEIAAEYEAIERTLYLCDQFTKEKVALLTERINNSFKTVSFRLFQTQINGGIKEDCEVLVPSAEGRLVPYAYANNAARINAGLEIINVLSENWGVSVPVFIDNAESVTKLIDTDMQTIRLVVSEPDKTLRLEVMV